MASCMRGCWAMRAELRTKPCWSPLQLPASFSVAAELNRNRVLSSAWEPLSSEIRERIVQSGLEGGRHASDRPSKIVLQEGVLSGDLSSGEVRAKVNRGLTRRDWPERYDRAIRNYFSDDPQRPGSQRR